MDMLSHDEKSNLLARKPSFKMKSSHSTRRLSKVLESFPYQDVVNRLKQIGSQVSQYLQIYRAPLTQGGYLPSKPMSTSKYEYKKRDAAQALVKLLDSFSQDVIPVPQSIRNFADSIKNIIHYVEQAIAVKNAKSRFFGRNRHGGKIGVALKDKRLTDILNNVDRFHDFLLMREKAIDQLKKNDDSKKIETAPSVPSLDKKHDAAHAVVKPSGNSNVMIQRSMPIMPSQSSRARGMTFVNCTFHLGSETKSVKVASTDRQPEGIALPEALGEGSCIMEAFSLAIERGFASVDRDAKSALPKGC